MGDPPPLNDCSMTILTLFEALENVQTTTMARGCVRKRIKSHAWRFSEDWRFPQCMTFAAYCYKLLITLSHNPLPRGASLSPAVSLPSLHPTFALTTHVL